MSTNAAPEMTDEELKRTFPLPEFLPTEKLGYIGSKQDREGRFWVFFHYPYNWLHAPWSARPIVSSRKIELGIRARWNDEYPDTPTGDYFCIDQLRGEKDAALGELLDQMPRPNFKWIGSVQVPFLPEAVTFVAK